jgi:hypothetical protein
MAKTKRAINVRDSLPLEELSKKLPGKPHPDTLRRYCRCGVKSKTTHRVVKMAFILRPYAMASTVDAYYQFLEEVNGIQHTPGGRDDLSSRADR